MTRKPVTNVAHSVRQQLKNEALRTGRLYNEIEQYYAIERFLYRLSQSSYQQRFILKGALLFTVWQNNTFRPTRDIDLLGSIDNSHENITAVFQDVCNQDVVDDGLSFDSSSITMETIAQDAKYEGVRVHIEGHLDTSVIRIQVDIGFSDAVIPSPVEIEYPVLLKFPSPRLRSYGRETVVAEKFEAMALLGEANSRMKDFADVWHLSQIFEFDGESLSKAISSTFESRGTEMPLQPLALTSRFAEIEKIRLRWAAFVRRSRTKEIPSEMGVIVHDIAVLLQPVIGHLVSDDSCPDKWIPGKGWGNEA